MANNYDVIVIGAGAAGLSSAIGCAIMGAKTAIVEKAKHMGGDCLHTGCVPSKTLIRAAKVAQLMRRGKEFGLNSVQPKYDFSKVIMRDMEKPNQRASLAISPRLSKILVNLSGAKQENLLLDPFCRVGGILQEALIKNINVYGTDKDEEAIRQAEENLRWLKSNYNVKSSLILETIDSRDCPNKDFDAVATETPLGKVLRKRVPGKEAKKMIQNFESFIIPVLKRLKKIKKEDARIAITFPVIGRFRTSPEKIEWPFYWEVLSNPHRIAEGFITPPS